MGRNKSRWVCQECGFQSVRFMGRCTECNSWNSLVEESVVDEPAKGTLRQASQLPGPAMRLGDIPMDQAARISTGLDDVDEVLGGGLVPGSVVLLAGDPGIGKSTLLLQVANNIASNSQVLYVSGEESAQQVKLRAERLGLTNPGILVDSQQEVLSIEKRLLDTQTTVAVIDSIQSIYHPELSSAPGSVSQVRECASLISAAAKSQAVATILVGHVTKDGSIAGPRVLEHMVDVVLQFEGERHSQLRILKAVKNRYGSTAEVGIFAMSEQGLCQVSNPSSLFLAERLSRIDGGRAPSGTSVIAGGEGARTLLLEVQALVGASPYPSPRRVANGWDLNRLLQILAVLEKKVGVSLMRSDVYVNIAGGFEFGDPAGDLGVAIAIATSALDRSVDPKMMLIGEIGLTGEVRPVAGIERRLKEAARMGFERAIIPKGNLKNASVSSRLAIVGVEFLIEAMEAVMPGYQVYRPEPRLEEAIELKR